MKIKLVGLTCSACKKLTEKRIGKIPGVVKVEVDLSTGMADIVTDKNISLNEINKTFEGTNYHAESIINT